jgi:nicotinamidase-related amidase
MTIATLDPKTALVVIDLQQGLAGFSTLEPLAAMVEKGAALAKAFRAQGLPVVLVNVDGMPPGRTEQGPRITSLPPGFADFVPELGRQPEDIVITKQTAGAFTNTALRQELEARGMTQIVLCGVSTSMGVESTARTAYELGFNVAFAVDAMTDMAVETHAHSLDHVFPRLGERGTTAEIVALLDGRS